MSSWMNYQNGSISQNNSNTLSSSQPAAKAFSPSYTTVCGCDYASQTQEHRESECYGEYNGRKDLEHTGCTIFNDKQLVEPQVNCEHIENGCGYLYGGGYDCPIDCCGYCTAPFENCTNYRLDYRGLDQQRPDAIRKMDNLVMPDAPFENCTNYRLDYRGREQERPDAVRMPDNLGLTDAPFDNCTMYRTDYRDHDQIRPTLVKKSDHILLSDAPFAGCSTYRSDFRGCSGDRPDLMLKGDALRIPEGCLDLDTIYRKDFGSNPLLRAKPAKLVDNLKVPLGCYC